MIPFTESLAIVGLLVLLLVAGRAGRPNPARQQRRATRDARRNALELARALARQGATTTAIAHQARLPYDVATLTVQLHRVPMVGQKMPRAAAPAAARQKWSA
ncbi:MAG: hypothetical protein KF709_10365 [Gemmatimonadaceae bacterium]|nr:hypothetical protein [Gemmatimonadaceae bacterium]